MKQMLCISPPRLAEILNSVLSRDLSLQGAWLPLDAALPHPILKRAEKVCMVSLLRSFCLETKMT
jgi:hypothetical protein